MTNEQVPANAMCLNAGDITITESTAAEGAATTYDVSLLARSSGPIEHWYWGQQTVHDFSGMRVAEKIPIDFNHDTAEVIGFLDTFSQEAEGLRVSGKLVSFGDNDRAAEIAKKAKAGIPWQASINFGGDGITVEKLSENTSTTVNARQLSGPATIIRTFPLRGVAITPYGADENTESVVLSGKNEFTVTFTEETQMSDIEQLEEELQVEDAAAENDQPQDEAQVDDAVEEVAEEEEQAEEQAADPGYKVVLSQEDGQRYVELFGQQGAVWFIEGKSVTECFGLHVANLQEQVAKLTAENQNLQALVDSQEDGEEALAFSQGPQPVSELAARAKELQAKGIENDFVAKMAAKIENQIQ
tara:strand:+ start:893 stop:1966 length:1074 start_codon:yes stop_codon:yes gene_type:complete